MQLSVIIVSFNVKYFLEQCLHSVRCACTGLQAEVIVVDNASTDGSTQYLQARFPEVVFLPQTANLGFGRACNLGWQQAKGRYILFLNPDTIVAEDTLHTGLHFLQQHPEAGAVGVRMIDGTGVFLKESKRGFPGPLTALFKLTGLARLWPRSPLFARYYLGHLAEGQNHEVDVLAGAFMLMPQKVLEQVGAFDEAFFMYGEDIDLSYRIKKAGFKNFYLAQTAIVHFKGESTRRASLAFVRRFYGAMGIFVKKWHRGAGAALLRAVLQVAIFASAALSFLSKTTKPRRRHLPGAAGAGPLFIWGSSGQWQRLAPFLCNNNQPCRHVSSAAEAECLPPGGRLVFCQKPLSFKAMIQFMQQHPKQFRYRFHAAGSGSIVGSDSSDAPGETIAGC